MRLQQMSELCLPLTGKHTAFEVCGIFSHCLIKATFLWSERLVTLSSFIVVLDPHAVFDATVQCHSERMHCIEYYCSYPLQALLRMSDRML